MRHQLKNWVVISALAALLSGCSGTDPFRDTLESIDGDVVLGVARVQLQPSGTTLTQGDNNQAIQFLAYALDEENRPVEGASVSFIIDGTAVGKAILVVSQARTDAGGIARAQLVPGSAASSDTLSVGAAVGDVMTSSPLAITIASANATDPVSPSLVRMVASPKNQLGTGDVNATDGITLTAIVADANNNLMSGVNMQFSVTGTDSGTPGVVQVTRGTTDNTGTAQAILTTAGSPKNRTITVTASPAGDTGTSATLNIPVTGTTITVSGPQSLGAGSQGQYKITLRDSKGFGLSNQVVRVFLIEGASSSNPQVSSSSMPVATPVTDVEGRADVTIRATTNSAFVIVEALEKSSTDRLYVTVADSSLAFNAAVNEIDINLGVCKRLTAVYREVGQVVGGQQVRFSTSRGSLYGGATCSGTASSSQTNGSGVAEIFLRSEGAGGAGPAIISAQHANGAVDAINVEFIATSPTQIKAQAEPATVPIAGTSSIKAIVRDQFNNLVKNQVVTFNLANDPTGGRLLAATATTDSQGVAVVTYQASNASSAKNGVEVSAALQSAPSVPASSALLTVGGKALRIVLGTGNQIIEPTTTTYEKPYVAIVTDAAGNPAPKETVFRLSVKTIAYAKGYYCYLDPVWVPQYTIGATAPYDCTTLPATTTGFCADEDTDDDGILDAGEDVNGDRFLTPGNIVSVPSTIELDENGIAEFNLTYAQEYASWIEVELRAVASVEGTETDEVLSFILTGAASDFNREDVAPPGSPSRFGIGTECTDTF